MTHMPTWYGNVCRSGARSLREQPSDSEQSAREMARRRADQPAIPPTGRSDSPLGGTLPNRSLRGRCV